MPFIHGFSKLMDNHPWITFEISQNMDIPWNGSWHGYPWVTLWIMDGDSCGVELCSFCNLKKLYWCINFLFIWNNFDQMYKSFHERFSCIKPCCSVGFDVLEFLVLRSKWGLHRRKCVVNIGLLFQRIRQHTHWAVLLTLKARTTILITQPISGVADNKKHTSSPKKFLQCKTTIAITTTIK